jgi:hypothetical protein
MGLYDFNSRRQTPQVQRLETGAQRLQRGTIRFSSGSYARIPTDALTTVRSKQILDLSNGVIKKIGGVPPSANNPGFAYTSTDSTITWYWDGTNGSSVLVINRSDGSRFTVPTSGSGLTISGLTAATDYYFLPSWNTNNVCNVGWVQGTQGTPQIAFTLADTTDPVNSPFYVMQQGLQGNEPLAGFIKGTTAAGGGSGGGSGGGGPSCVMAGTDLDTVGDLPYTIELYPETDWVHLKIEDGRDLYCTNDHPLYHSKNGRVRADSIAEGDIVITDSGEQLITLAYFTRRVCSKHCIKMQKGHLYFANGFLSHNVKIKSLL